MSASLPDLLCPQCAYAGALSEFVPPKLTSRFDGVAFVLLTIVSVLAFLKYCGVIK